jgi:hypothetical protein
MKRFTVFGLCLISAFAISVVVAASAQAGSEHGNLLIHSKGGESHLGLSGGVEVHSTANHGTGTFTSGTAGTAVGIFEGVQEEPGGLKCKSGSEPIGTVVTLPLIEETGWITKGSDAGVDFKAAGTFLAEFSCEGGTAFTVEGSVIGHVGPQNTLGPGTLNLEGVGFKNSPENFEGGPTDVLLSHINNGPATQSIQVQKNIETQPISTKGCKPPKGSKPEKCKFAKYAELNTVVNPARPEIGRCNKQKGGAYTNNTCTEATPAGGKGKYEFNPAGS